MCYLETTNFVSIRIKKANSGKTNEIKSGKSCAVIYTKSKKHQEPYLQLKKK